MCILQDGTLHDGRPFCQRSRSEIRPDPFMIPEFMAVSHAPAVKPEKRRLFAPKTRQKKEKKSQFR
jgi:hypothetical protein